MNPDQPTPKPANTPLVPESSIQNPEPSEAQQQATVAVVRAQIDSLYDKNQPTTQIEDVNPYDRTHVNNLPPDQDQWKQYHTAWQNYYQKYYEGYYTHHLQQAIGSNDRANKSNGYFNNQPKEAEATKQTVSKDEALFDLRQQLLTKVSDSVTKVRSSRHFIPIISAIIVIMIFAFMQYNQLIIANVTAYISPGSIDPQNIVVDPSKDITTTPDPRLIIPKINVDVPVFYDVGNDYKSQMDAMQKGVAHFAIPGASSHPGQIGNTVISGHSSNDLLDQGDYKFIFAQLEKLNIGDTIYANYQSKRYTYTITTKEVVRPSEVNKLVYPTDKPILTLITCTPLGTSTNRLLITAEQVSPDIASSVAAPIVTSSTQATLPGQSAPTIFERIFNR